MIPTETREQVKTMVAESPEGISLTKLHNKVQRMITRLQLRTMLGTLYMNGEISRERISALNRRETRYYPFNGQSPYRRKQKPQKQTGGDILSMKDFMPGGDYMPYISE